MEKKPNHTQGYSSQPRPKPSEVPTSIKLPRLYHTKSKTGCSRCRARRVKCDENRPICGSCYRHSVPCEYIESRPISSKPSKQSKESLYTARASDSNSLDLPESKSRRLLELRLLQNYIQNTSTTLPACHNENVRHAWSVEVPNLAFENDNLLYEMFSLSALHLLKSDPDNPELLVARQEYLGLSLREHRKAVAGLDSKSADAVCFASSLILIDSFASLQDRSLDPYLPPMEWLQMARGAGPVFRIAFNALDNFETAKIMAIARARPFLADGDVLFAENNREGLADLLDQNIPGEIWDLETAQAYEKTLSYIGCIQLALKSGEHKMGICRRMIAFALLVPRKFVEFVEEKRPRALVIVAHFFALASDMEDVWWIGRTARREVLGIQKVLPSEWQSMMASPLKSIS
ncbi:hypothetical protein DL98DRAFT_409942 [Cadophora sp. DSE1049]|nr:hypothetical protein DL98DRAFT_409942 [Cadophora sp. DSE1049]